MTNIFKNAYFGKLYKTRGGDRKAVFIKYTEYSHEVVCLVYEGKPSIRTVLSNGHCLGSHVETDDDIISEC